MHNNKPEEFFEPTAVLSALKEAARQAARAHWFAGVKMVSWEDGKIVYLDPLDVNPDANKPAKPLENVRSSN